MFRRLVVEVSVKLYNFVSFHESRSISSSSIISTFKTIVVAELYLTGSSYWFSIDYKFNLRDRFVVFSVYLPQTDWFERIATIITLFNFIRTGRTSLFTALIVV